MHQTTCEADTFRKMKYRDTAITIAVWRPNCNGFPQKAGVLLSVPSPSIIPVLPELWLSGEGAAPHSLLTVPVAHQPNRASTLPQPAPKSACLPWPSASKALRHMLKVKHKSKQLEVGGT